MGLLIGLLLRSCDRSLVRDTRPSVARTHGIVAEIVARIPVSESRWPAAASEATVDVVYPEGSR